jgi:hypothetical protein
VENKVPMVSCFHEITKPEIGKVLAKNGFIIDKGDYIVKGIEY